MKKYLICNRGCDDSTEFEIELTDEEVKTLVKVFNENNKKASYQCKPAIYIYDEYEAEKDEDEEDIDYIDYYGRHRLNKSYEELEGEDK